MDVVCDSGGCFTCIILIIAISVQLSVFEHVDLFASMDLDARLVFLVEPDSVDDVHIQILVLWVGLEHPRLGLLEHVDLPTLVDLDAILVHRVEHDGGDDVSHLRLLVHHVVHVHVLVLLALGGGLEHPHLGLLEHVDLPVSVDLDVSLVLLVEHDSVDDVHVHVLVLGVGLEHLIPFLRLLMHVELPASVGLNANLSVDAVSLLLRVEHDRITDVDHHSLVLRVEHTCVNASIALFM
jgi:hypothetical protein